MSEKGDASLAKTCPNCGGDELYCRRLSSAGGEGPRLLAGLGSFLHYADLDVVVCANCGLTQFYAEPEARQNAKTNENWKRL